MSPRKKKETKKANEKQVIKSSSPFDMPLRVNKNPKQIPSSPTKSNFNRLEQRAVVIGTCSGVWLIHFCHHMNDNEGAYLGDLNKRVLLPEEDICPSITAVTERKLPSGDKMTISSVSTYPWFTFMHTVGDDEEDTPASRREYCRLVCDAFNKYSEQKHRNYDKDVADGKTGYLVVSSTTRIRHQKLRNRYPTTLVSTWPP